MLETITEDEGKEFYLVIFGSIDCQAIQQAALKTSGAAGPSGHDARAWKRMCEVFKRPSSCLCNNLALVAKKLSTRYLNPVGITAFTSSRLIAIDKQPGVQPIAIGKVPRCNISKAILSVVKSDALEVTRSVQLCAGQEAGCETVVHAMRATLEGEHTQAVVLWMHRILLTCLTSS